MPQAMIDTGLADAVLAPAEMPGRLLEFVRRPQAGAAGRAAPEEESIADLEAILKLLRTRTHSDFSHYKRAALSRRVHRRMGLRQVAGVGEYIKLLDEDADELTQLAKDMLIGVSSFFRDTAVFESLRDRIVVPLVQAKPDDAPLRAWVAGCATGEEAYSIAMLLLEARAAAGKNCPVLVFATDIDEQSLETARTGAYPLSIAADVPAPQLEAYFTKQGQSYQVVKQLREAVVFSRHNLLIDPPFLKLDLLSCRNVLIYIESPAQKKVLTVFSFALNVGGCLLLGRSEGVTGMDNLFETVSKRERIFRLTRSNRRAAMEFPLYAAGRQPSSVDRERTGGDTPLLPQANLDALLQHFAASAVLIDAEGKILYFHGRTEKYLGHSKGFASLNILDITDGMLSAKLQRAINKVLQQDEPVHLAQIPLPGEHSAVASLTVMRLGDLAGGGKLLAVIFEDAQLPRHPSSTHPVPVEDEPLVAQLEAEVKALRTELRTNVEGYDTATEELKAANEEVMSMNEELQSANEELEASKEELQSLNEEMTTINAQLNDKVSELTEANNDLANLLMATEIATIFLDTKLRIRRFTPRATELLNVIDSDVGRPIGHITQNFTGVDLAADAGNVLKSLVPLEKEAEARDGRWYTVRILPYRTLDNRIDGSVVTFSDVTRLKLTEHQLRFEKTYTERIIETVRHPLLVLDGQLMVLSANHAFYKTFRVEPGDTIGQQVYDLRERELNLPQLRTLLEEVIPKESAFEDFRVEHSFAQIGRKVMQWSGRRIQPTGDMPERLLLTIEDITEREKDREELGLLNDDLEQRVTDRTALAEQRSDQLRRLAAELAHSEQRERERLARLLHDNLQQLLVAVKFQLATVRFCVPDEQAQKAVALMDDLLKQSLDASKTLTVELSPTILYEGGLEAALPWLARLMEKQHDLKVDTQINAAVPLDEDGVVFLLFSAVRELLLNVVKHADVDSARVQVDRPDGDSVRIVVADAGKGFDPATSRAGEDAATGLGLFGLQQRLEHIRGKCTVDSAPGRGTRVTLTAKVGRPAEPPRPVAAKLELKAPEDFSIPTADRTDSTIRVLLVDDHLIVRQGLAAIVNAEPDMAVIAEASDGQTAVQQAHIHRPDVIVMDVNMPNMNGIDATKAIMAELPDTKIIGLSMHEAADQAETMRQAGAVGYVNKGGPSDGLIAAIRTGVGRTTAPE